MNAGVNALHLWRDRHYEIQEVKATDIDPTNGNSAHSLIVGMISEGSVVLDIGCSYGYLGEWLVRNKNCTVYGIERDGIALEEARSKGVYADVFEIDLDSPSDYQEDHERFRDLDLTFDHLICADVLEHLKDPTTALSSLVVKLKEGGTVLVSVPNVANIDVILNLIEGRFNYSRVGILDTTHLRFFTKTSFDEWIESINADLLKDFRLDVRLAGSTKTLSEFAEVVQSSCPETYRLLTRALGEEATVLQYIFELTKKKSNGGGPLSTHPSTPEPQRIGLIEERLRELSWSLECASRIFKKKHAVSTRQKKMLLASERKVVQLERELRQKEDAIRRLRDLAYRITPLTTTKRPAVITEKISVIIPVKNGGGHLRSLLEGIRRQRRVEDVEIVVVDSGSTDDSVSTAREFGAKIIEIPASEFNHGESRNLGVGGASGNYMVFTVQDALPINNYWLYNMVCPLIEHPRLAALTSRQFVKPEADLFSLWMAERLSDFLDLKGDSIYSLREDFDSADWRFLDSATKRRLSFFDNVSSCVRRDVIKEVRFSPLINAEDIDFGVKLCRRKQPLGYLASTGVYHWHDRGADYVFKRHYMGTKADVHILGNDLFHSFASNGIGWNSLMADVAAIYTLIRVSLPGPGGVDREPMRAMKSFIDAVNHHMDEHGYKAGSFAEATMVRSDSTLDRLLSEMTGDIGRLEFSFSESVLIQDLMRHLQDFTGYLYSKRIDLAGRENDFISCIYKVFALTAGEALGAFYLEAESLNRLTPELRRIDRTLGRGVCYF